MKRALAPLVSRRPDLACDQRGFSLIEATVAMVIFIIVATGLAGLLASGVKQHSLTRQKTLAKEEALTQIEKIRRWPYTDMGFVAGNPSGTIPAAEANKQISLTTGGASGTSTGTMVTQISYIDDPTPTSYATSANYKRITVTVTRNLDGKQLIKSVTYVAPSTRAPFGGINNAIINATISDYALSTPLQNATVSLAAGPSAPRSDVTGATGTVTFAALTPTTGAQPYYDLTATLAGYDTMPEDLPPNATARFALAPAQTRNTSIRLFKPATIYVNVPDFSQGVPPGTCVVSGFKIYIASSRKAQSIDYPCAGGTWTINTINGEKIIPGISYTVGVMKEVNPGPSRFYAPSTTATVPAGYPSTLTTTFTMTLGSALANNGLTVRVRKSGSPVIGTRVDVQGGPSPGYFLTGVTNGSGNALFNVPRTLNPCTAPPQASASCYTVTAWNAAGTGTGQQLNLQVSSNTSTTVNVP